TPALVATVAVRPRSVCSCSFAAAAHGLNGLTKPSASVWITMSSSETSGPLSFWDKTQSPRPCSNDSHPRQISCGLDPRLAASHRLRFHFAPHAPHIPQPKPSAQSLAAPPQSSTLLPREQSKPKPFAS